MLRWLGRDAGRPYVLPPARWGAHQPFHHGTLGTQPGLARQATAVGACRVHSRHCKQQAKCSQRKKPAPPANRSWPQEAASMEARAAPNRARCSCGSCSFTHQAACWACRSTAGAALVEHAAQSGRSAAAACCALAVALQHSATCSSARITVRAFPSWREAFAQRVVCLGTPQ